MHAINASLVNIWEREPLNMHFRILKRLVSTVVRGEYHERKKCQPCEQHSREYLQETFEDEPHEYVILPFLLDSFHHLSFVYPFSLLFFIFFGIFLNLVLQFEKHTRYCKFIKHKLVFFIFWSTNINSLNTWFYSQIDHKNQRFYFEYTLFVNKMYITGCLCH